MLALNLFFLKKMRVALTTLLALSVDDLLMSCQIPAGIPAPFGRWPTATQKVSPGVPFFLQTFSTFPWRAQLVFLERCVGDFCLELIVRSVRDFLVIESVFALAEANAKKCLLTCLTFHSISWFRAPSDGISESRDCPLNLMPQATLALTHLTLSYPLNGIKKKGEAPVRWNKVDPKWTLWNFFFIGTRRTCAVGTFNAIRNWDWLVMG